MQEEEEEEQEEEREREERNVATNMSVAFALEGPRHPRPHESSKTSHMSSQGCCSSYSKYAS